MTEHLSSHSMMTSSYSSVSSQLLTVLAVSFGPFSVGLSKGYSSPALASLAASNLGVTDILSEQHTRNSPMHACAKRAHA